ALACLDVESQRLAALIGLRRENHAAGRNLVREITLRREVREALTVGVHVRADEGVRVARTEHVDDRLAGIGGLRRVRCTEGRAGVVATAFRTAREGLVGSGCRRTRGRVSRAAVAEVPVAPGLLFRDGRDQYGRTTGREYR